jgi:predicted dehydrogenase
MSHSNRAAEHPSRRTVLAGVATAAVASLATGLPLRGNEETDREVKTFRAAVIGHTGRGDYGHGLDVIFNDVPGITVVALADLDDAGRAKAAERCGAAKQYADYREMLAQEKPDLVSIAPRHTDQHREMALAAIAAGAHLVMEKPIATDPAECDAILAAADAAKRKVAVAHQMRLAPRVARLTKALGDGLIGNLLHIDAWGKQDARAGGEDMMVLGTHLFDLIRLFAGDPQWCTARVLQNGKEISRADARAAGEAIGPVAGDEVFAQFAFPNGVNATFNSRGRLREVAGSWGIELTGSEGSVRLLTAIEPHVLVSPAGKWEPSGRTDQWRPLDGTPGSDDAFPPANRRVIDDWLAAIRADREPACGGRHAAAAAVEMVMAVYQAALAGARVSMPLAQRKHPLV